MEALELILDSNGMSSPEKHVPRFGVDLERRKALQRKISSTPGLTQQVVAKVRRFELFVSAGL